MLSGSYTVYVLVYLKVLILTYKAFSGLGPKYLKDCIFLYETSQVLKSLREYFLFIPPPSQMCLVGTEDLF